MEEQEGKCADCQKTLQRKQVQFDHRVPVARGGTNERKNLQALCTAWHAEKTLEENETGQYLQWEGTTSS